MPSPRILSLSAAYVLVLCSTTLTYAHELTSTADAAADLAINELEEMSLEELLDIRVTSATLTGQRIKEAPSIMTALGATQLRSLGVRTLADALKLIPGASVLERKFGKPLFALRSVTHDACILVSFDGQRLNDFYDGYFPIALPIEAVDRIEVVRGPGSAIYGTNAFSGVVSMFSETKPGTHAGVVGETLLDDAVGYGILTHARHAETIHETWTVSGNAAYRQSTGPRVMVKKDVSQPDYSVVPSVGDNFEGMGFGNLAVERIDILGSDRLRVAALGLFGSHGSFFGPQWTMTTDNELWRASWHTYVDYQWSPKSIPLTVTGRLSHATNQRRDLVQLEPDGYYYDENKNGHVDPGETFVEGRLRRTTHRSNQDTLRLMASHRLGDFKIIEASELLVGFELEHSSLDRFSFAKNEKNGVYQPGRLENWDEAELLQANKTRTTLALFIQEQAGFRGGVSMTLGARYDYYDDFGGSFNPRAALVWQPWDVLSCKIMYGSAFRAPTFRELYDRTELTSSRARVLGNPELKPETTDTYEIGFDLQPIQGVMLRGNGFLIHTDNEINPDPNFYLTGNPLLNYPGRRVLGFELAGQFAFVSGVALSVDISWFQAKQLGDGIEATEGLVFIEFQSKDLTEVPGTRLNAMVITDLVPRTILGLRYGLVGYSESNRRFQWEQFDNAFERPAYHEYGINARVAAVEDLLNILVTVDGSMGKLIAVTLPKETHYIPAPRFRARVGIEVFD